MAGSSDRPAEKWEAAVAALLSHGTIEEAAAAVGVCTRTLKEWKRQPGFQEMYAAAREELLERAVARLLGLLTKAADALERNLECGKPAAEIRAAGLVYAQALDSLKTLDLAQQLTELRQRLENLHADPDGTGTGPAEAGDGGRGGPAGGPPGGEPGGLRG